MRTFSWRFQVKLEVIVLNYHLMLFRSRYYIDYHSTINRLKNSNYLRTGLNGNTDDLDIIYPTSNSILSIYIKSHVIEFTFCNIMFPL